MDKLQRQLDEDRALRDTALGLLKGDIDHVRSDLERKGIGERVADRVSSGAMELFDGGVALATANRGLFAAGAAAVVIWLARHPILNGLAALLPADQTDEEMPEPQDGPDRSDQD